MLIGSQTNTLDSKNRVFVPAAFRADLGDRFILNLGTDTRSLYIFPLDAWQTFQEKLLSIKANKNDFDQIRRYYTHMASLCEPDSQGRIVIPQVLRESAGITKEVLFIGTITGIEVWSPDRLVMPGAEEIASKLEELDIIF